MIRHPTAFIERSFARFLALGYFDTFNRRLVAAYRERATVMADALARHLPEARHPLVTGGSSFWIEGPRWRSIPWTPGRCRSRAERVLIEPGDVHFAQDGPPLNFFRLGFSSIGPAAIAEGIRRLGGLFGRQRPRR